MSVFYCVANWKMNKNSEQAEHFLRQLKAEAPANVQADLVILPPALIAHKVAELLRGTAFAWGGQNSFHEAGGAFTGENSPALMREMGARYCLVGHSERRLIFAEPDEMIAKKLRYLQDLGMTPILCVGETVDDRRWNRSKEVISRQLRAALKLADPEKPLWLAYEPVWAIGTGLVADPVQIDEAHKMLRKMVSEWRKGDGRRETSNSRGAVGAGDVPILYGGSVKADNARTMAALECVNGFLIGGASLDASEFLGLCTVSRDARKIGAHS